MRWEPICLILALAACTSASPENQPHQNTIIKMGGVSNVAVASDLSWVHSTPLIYGTVDLAPSRKHFCVHLNGTGLEIVSSPASSASSFGSEDKRASRRFAFANGATAYLDAKSNLVVTLVNGHTFIVEPSITFYFPWTPPPSPASGIACDCGLPGGVEVIPYILGVVDGNFLVYRAGPNQETRIFGLKQDRKSRLKLPMGYFLDDIGHG